MFEIDKEKFGEFIAELRKEKGYTQKEFAEKLFISDKAVSKWERGLSIPDVALLIPIADILGVTVSELLEGKRLGDTTQVRTDHAEELVKKALTLSVDNKELDKANRKRGILIYLILLATCAGELIFFGVLMKHFGFRFPYESIPLLISLAAIFGIYFWIVLKDRIPTYYDENKISYIVSYGFRINLPGVCFNNSNWPHILKALKNWSALTMIICPIICCCINMIITSYGASLAVQYIIVGIDMIWLFASIYIAAARE